MSSGGDLDGESVRFFRIDGSFFVVGDTFFVCWDPDVVPPRVHEVGILRVITHA